MSVTYRLEENTLHISYEATPDKDTIINMTNHSYFNLNGSGDILDHMVVINASRFTPSDAQSIPTGEYADVEGTPMDFREPKAIGAEIGADYTQLLQGRGYDHNYVIDDYDGAVRYAVHLYRNLPVSSWIFPPIIRASRCIPPTIWRTPTVKTAPSTTRETLSVLSRSSSRTPSINQHSKSGLSAGTLFHKEIVYTFSIDR